MKCKACGNAVDLSINGKTFCAKHMKAELTRRKKMRPEYQCGACGWIAAEQVGCSCGAGVMKRRKPNKVATVDVFALLERVGMTGMVLDKDSMETAVKQTMYQLEEMRDLLEPKRRKRKTTRRTPKKTGGYVDKKQADRAAWNKKVLESARASKAATLKAHQDAALARMGDELRIRRPAMTNG